MSEDYNKQLSWHEIDYPPIKDVPTTGIEALDKGLPRGKLNVWLGALNERLSKTTMMMDLMFKHRKDIIVSPYLDMEMAPPYSDNTVVIDSIEKE